MQPFEYASPKTLQDAVRLLGNNWHEARPLAGGTDLVSAMKDEIEKPRRVVNLKHIRGLGGIEFNSRTGLRVGALTTIHELLGNKEAQRHYPGLVDAADGIRGEQMRHMGTVGGELLQRPRDWYYRNGYGLLGTYQGKALIPNGENQYAAILGNGGPAYFVSPSSLAPILIALGARVTLHGPAGNRELEVAKLYVTPSSESEPEHAIKPNEILTEVRIPAHAMASMATYEVRQKEALDWPLAAAAVVLHMNGNTVRGARVVLGHVAPVPWPSREAEEALQGKEISEETADAAGKSAVSKAAPLSRNAYKVQLARVAVKRAILAAAKRGA